MKEKKIIYTGEMFSYSVPFEKKNYDFQRGKSVAVPEVLFDKLIGNSNIWKSGETIREASENKMIDINETKTKNRIPKS